jgi:hypothetical protein
MAGASEVVDAVSQILPNINLAIRISDFINDLHAIAILRASSEP